MRRLHVCVLGKIDADTQNSNTFRVCGHGRTNCQRVRRITRTERKLLRYMVSEDSQRCRRFGGCQRRGCSGEVFYAGKVHKVNLLTPSGGGEFGERVCGEVSGME